MTMEISTRPGLPGHLREDGYDLPAGLPFEHWLEIGETLQQMERSVQWWLGDWWNYGERTYGEMASQATKDMVKDVTGYAYSTINKAGWVARQFEDVRRRTNLPWSHHAEVVSLPVPEQESLLDRAERAGMTRYDLRDAVRERKRALEDQSATPESESLVWIPQRSDLTDEARASLDQRLAGVGRRHAIGYERGFLDALVYTDQQDAFRAWKGPTDV